MTDLYGMIYRGQSGLSGGGNTFDPRQVMLNTLGEQIVMDWLQKAVMDGSVFQVRAGTITTPITGQVDVTDAASEMSADAASGTTIMPVRINVDIEALGGTLPNITAKSVATVSSAGTAFVPLALRSDGPAAISTARAQTAGNVVVTAELATTTLRHLSLTQSAIGDPAGHQVIQLIPAPVLVGARCFYIQVGTVTTGSSYWASFEYVEYDSTLVAR